MADLPLSGLNIVITRPRAQAVDLARRIEQLGGTPLSFPLLEIEPVGDPQALHEQLSRLQQTDLAIFVSPNAVHYGMEAIRAAGGLPRSLQVATVGQGSARALHEQGVAQVLAPSGRSDSEALLALPELQQVAGRRVMIFRGNGGRELLGDTLRARGATVEYIECYRRSKPELDVAALLARQPHAVAVSSSEALAHLRELLGPSGRAGLMAMPLFLGHERIAEAARQQGWQHIYVTGAGDDGLLSGLVAWAHDRRK
ncbi:uroporphyrinogen-III synthase [Sideroxyarcus emersonii]|uniref:Uroporphyrinogen-III synthase n=1 Tax=Sideroxyarcus emersonii TaxID=2764705 RepID=A0AAN1X7H2_9PROT|nr:uroporphyrinogen-III synthase [Sideroxyarcus emersonii]BCK86412.1 uroporphyrinogen-III synthase [Sideroxyarcus emersonii]